MDRTHVSVKAAPARPLEVLATSAAANAAPARPVRELPAGAPSHFAGRRIHFIGIGGCGMSGLARLLAQLGSICSGSDSTASAITRELVGRGIPVAIGSKVAAADGAAPLPEGTDLVIASAAIKPDHPEMLAAEARGLPVLTYAEALGQVQAERTGVSIAGTHGKSTTAAMLCHVLIQCGLDPSFIVGAMCEQIGGGSRVGADVLPGRGPMASAPGVLIAEACEFNRSFHHHRPVLGLINNVEEDHLDIYGSLEQIVEAFRGFAQLIPPKDSGGWLLIAHEGAHRREITAGLECAVETFGFNPAADYRVSFDPETARTELRRGGELLTGWKTALPGDHNALNAAAAAIIAHRLGAPWEAIGEALSSFRGLDRRMQRLGTKKVQGGEVVVYDDYGHHPTEIEATLRALRQAEGPGRLICVFQPHQHSRTRFLMEQFARSFEAADVVIVPQIYFVRDSELEKSRVSAADLVDRLRGRGVSAMHLYPFEAIVEQLEVMCRPGDLVVIMGAGPVWQVAWRFLGREVD